MKRSGAHDPSNDANGHDDGPRRSPRSLSDRALRSVSQALARHAGLVGGRRGSMRDELERAWRRSGVPDLEHYAADLAAGRISLSALVEETRVHESYLYREPGQLELVTRRLERARAEGRTLRIWSAGCASGEEPYTLAMLAIEVGVAVHVVGTDISPNAIERARSGEYTPWALRGPAKDRAVPFLVAKGGKLTVVPKVRENVAFHVHNLVVDPVPVGPGDGAWDIVLCRNVLMYFSEEARTMVIDKFAAALSPSGLLILGACDPLVQNAVFETRTTESGIVYFKRPRAEPSGRAPGTGPFAGSSGSSDSSGRSGSSGRTDPTNLSKVSGLASLPDLPLRRNRHRPARAPVSPRGAARRSASSNDDVREELREDLGKPASRFDANEATPQPTFDPGPGFESLVSGNTEELLDKASLLESRDPLDARAACLRGLAAAELGADRDAHEAFRRALYIDPFLVVAELGQAMLFEREGQPAQALAAYRRALVTARGRAPTEVVPMMTGAHVADVDAHCRRRIAVLSAIAGESPESRR